MSQKAIEVDVSPEELEKLEEIVDEINKAIASMPATERGKPDYLAILNKIHSIVSENMELIKKIPELYNSLVESEYALAYNALVDYANPNEVKSLVIPEVWDRIKEDLGSLGSALIEYLIFERRIDDASRLYEWYKDYLDPEEREKILVLMDKRFQDLVDALRSGDLEKAGSIIEEIEKSGDYEKFKTILNLVYSVNLDDVRKAYYMSRIYEILNSASGPEDALAKLRQAEDVARKAGLEDVVRDLEAVVTAVGEAEKGDVDAFVTAVKSIQSDAFRRYALLVGMSVIEEKHLDSLVSASEQTRNELKELLSSYGVQVDLDKLVLVARAVELIRELNGLMAKKDYEGALELWESASEDVRETAAGIVGVSPREIEEMIRDSIEVSRAASRAEEIVSLLDNGEYGEALRIWESLDANTKALVAALLNVKQDEFDHYLRLRAGLEEVSKLENPTLDEIVSVLSKYISEDEARRIAEEMLKSTVVYRVKELVEKGDYDGALSEALRAASEDDQRKLVEYILASINEKRGAKAMAEFILKHRVVVEKLLGEEIVKRASEILEAEAIAEEAYDILSKAVEEEYASRIEGVIREFEAKLKQGDLRGAEEVLVRNAKLLSKAKLESGESILDILAEILSYSLNYEMLEKASRELGDALKSVASSPDSALSEADGVIKLAESYISDIESWKHAPDNVKRRLVEAWKRILGYAHVVRAQALAYKGMYRDALREAEEALKVTEDPGVKDMAETIGALVSSVLDPTAFQENIECIAENIVGIRPEGGHKPGHIYYT